MKKVKKEMIGVIFTLIFFGGLMLCSCSETTNELTSKETTEKSEKLQVSYNTIAFKDTDSLLFGKYPTPSKQIVCAFMNAKGDKMEFNYYLYLNLKVRDTIIKDATLFANSNARVVCCDTICFRDSLLIRFAEEDVKKVHFLPFCEIQRELNNYLRKEIYKKGAARTFSW